MEINTNPCKLKLSIVHVRVKFPLATYFPMSMNGSILVSMSSIMALSSDFFYQQMKEAVVGKSLQQIILILRQVIRNIGLRAVSL